MSTPIEVQPAPQRSNARVELVREFPAAVIVRMAFVLALLASPAFVFAQSDNGWIGKRVITKFGAVLRVNNAVVDNEKLETRARGGQRNVSRIYRVQQINGPWLWLKAEKSGAAGWITAEWLVPYDQAIDYFTNEIRANPAAGSAYTRRGQIWREKKEPDIAIADYNEAIRLDPENEIAWANRGNAWSDKKDFDRAIADYNEAIRLDPNYALAYTGRGAAWFDKKDYDKAIADFNEAVRLDPNDAIFHSNRGAAWFDKKDYDKAIADFNEAVRLDPNDAISHSNRGAAWFDKKDYDKAIADFNEAVRLDPKGSDVYNKRAWLLATCPDSKFRDGKTAVESAKKSCELSEWKGAYPIGTLAAACAEAGDYDEAVKWQTKANGMYANADDKRKGEERLKLYQEKKPYRAISP